MTILNTINTPIYEFTWNAPAIAVAIVFGLLLLGMIAYIIYGACEYGAELITLLLFTIPLAILIFILVNSAGQMETGAYDTSYQVIFNEPQDMAELANKYEILDVQGQIYTIKEID